MFKVKNHSGGNQGIVRVKKRFGEYKGLTFWLGFIGLWSMIVSFYDLAKTTVGCKLGIITNLVDPEKLTPEFYIVTWFVLLVFVVAIFIVALGIDKIITHLDELEQEHLALVNMQDAYLRNAQIAEQHDALNGSYHNKIYKAAVRDIENIINK